MALTIGNTVVSTTTLATLVDTVFANKTGSLTGSSATYTAFDAQSLCASWPAVNNGDNAVYIYVLQHPRPPASILLS